MCHTDVLMAATILIVILFLSQSCMGDTKSNFCGIMDPVALSERTTLQYQGNI
jgi:hypothetical protein